MPSAHSAQAHLLPPDTGAWPGRVLLAGGTGAVGQELLARLATHPGVPALKVLLRRPFPLPAGAQALHTSWQDLAEHPEWFEVDTVFCALGTTIRQAGSQEAFRQVDHDHVLALARHAKAQGVRQFLVVSALGADAASRVFYNRVKGEMEQGLAAIGFESLTVAQPSLLLGERAEFRLGERLGQWGSRLAGGLMPARYRPVHVAQVAAALIDASQHPQPGLHVLDNIQLRKNPAP